VSGVVVAVVGGRVRREEEKEEERGIGAGFAVVEAVGAEGWGTRLGFLKEGGPVAVVAEPFGG